MNIREITEQNELTRLSKFATKNIDSKGRKYFQEKCNIRTDFQRDRDRIVHSKAFRRLMHKTQVFISPTGDHYRTRLSHTLEVSQIARTIARGLNLNEDLTEAIALGHDLGHTPFGHTGEDALSEIIGMPFEHNIQSVRIVEKIEKQGKGLNLTQETIDGIRTHRGRCKPSTLEGKIVQISDKIAYVNHDIDDAIRAKIITHQDLPSDVINLVGEDSSQRINFFIRDIISNSYEVNDIIISPRVKDGLYDLRAYLYEKVYCNNLLNKERSKVLHMFGEFYHFYKKNTHMLPSEYYKMIKKDEDISVVICDFIAGMTDRFSVQHYNQLFLPVSWDEQK